MIENDKTEQNKMALKDYKMKNQLEVKIRNKNNSKK